MGRKQGCALQRMGELREKGLRTGCRRLQGSSEPLHVLKVRLMAVCYAERDSRFFAMWLQHRQSESEVEAEVTTSDLAREPIARRPIRRLVPGAAGYLPRSDGLS